MDPEAQLIASQAMQELARQQATGQVDEVLRGQIAQQVLSGAGQQAMQREAQQKAADFRNMKQYGDVVAQGGIESRARAYSGNTDKISKFLQAITGAGSALAGEYANYAAEQDRLAKGLQSAEEKDGIAGAIKFLNQNPNYDPGSETLQRIYEQSEFGQQDAADMQIERDQNRARMLAAAQARMPDRIRGVFQRQNTALPAPSASDTQLAPVTRDSLNMPMEVPLAPYYEQRSSLATSTPTLQDQLDKLNEGYVRIENLTPEGRKKVIERYLDALGAM